MEAHSISTTPNLRRLCVEKNWFTAGSQEQYDKLFDANSRGFSLEAIATIIWLCSEDCEYSEILEELKLARDNYRALLRTISE